MTHYRTTSLRRAGLAVAACLLLAACAARTPAPVAPRTLPLSERASQTYDFLIYQDLLRQLQHLTMAQQGENPAPDFMKQRNDLMDQADEMLDRILATNPSPEIFLEKGLLHGNDQDGGASSRQIFKRGLEVFPDSRPLYLYLANSYLVSGDSQAAIDTMHDYLERAPDDLAAREQLGILLHDAQEWALALDELKRIPVDKRNADTLFYMARCQGKLGLNQQARKNLERALKKDPDYIEALAELAYQHELARDYVAAYDTYEVILAKGGDRGAVLARMVNLQLKLNNPDKALELALAGPRTKGFLLDAAMVFINDGFYAQASTVLDVMDEAGPLPAEYYFYKAHIANEGENDQVKALEYLEKIDKADRTYPQALRFRIQLTNILGRHAEAMRLSQEGRRMFPNSPIFYITEAALLSDQGRGERAVQVLESGLERIPDDPQLMYELGMLRESLGDRAGALEVMEQLIKNEPDNAHALNFVGYTLADEGRDLDRALVLINEADRLEPDSGYITDSQAWVRYHRGEYDKAWERIQVAVDLIGDEAVVWEHYGDIAAALGRTDEARKGYRKALELEPENPDAIRTKLEKL